MKGPCRDGPQVRAVSAGVAPAHRRARGAQDRERRQRLARQGGLRGRGRGWRHGVHRPHPGGLQEIGSLGRGHAGGMQGARGRHGVHLPHPGGLQEIGSLGRGYAGSTRATQDALTARSTGSDARHTRHVAAGQRQASAVQRQGATVCRQPSRIAWSEIVEARRDKRAPWNATKTSRQACERCTDAVVQPRSSAKANLAALPVVPSAARRSQLALHIE